jgi:hypothetical protein
VALDLVQNLSRYVAKLDVRTQSHEEKN